MSDDAGVGVVDMHYADLPLVARLQSIRQRMVQTSEEFMEELDKRDAKLHDQHRATREMYAHVEQAVVAESQRRAGIDHLLEATLDTRLSEVTKILDDAVSLQFARLEKAVTLVTDKIESVLSDIHDERRAHDEFVVAFQKEAAAISAELYREVERQRASRVEFETNFNRQRTKEMSFLSEQLGIQAQLRGKCSEALQDDLARVGRLLEKESYMKTCGSLLREVDETKLKAQEHAKLRESSQQALADAMSMLVQQINESFTDMSRGTRVLMSGKKTKKA
jgi:hypothetical protein